MQINKPIMISLAATLSVSLQPVMASENEELDRQSLPESTVSFGIGYVPQDNQFFGQYNGLHEEGVIPLLDIDYVSRNPETGYWLNVEGSNTGQDTRGLRIEALDQGDWEVDLEYRESSRNYPFTYNTGITGAGSGTVSVAGQPLADREFEVERRNGELTLTKTLGQGFDATIFLRSEKKDGARPWGTQGFNFVTEPIDFTTNEAIITLGYTDEKLQLSGGYIFSDFNNDHSVLNSDGGVSQVALPLDNQAHQLFLSGGYNFTPTTRGNFKLSHTINTQDETFFMVADGAGSAGRTNADGEVANTLAMAGLSMRPMRNLDLNAKLRFEERDDKTPRFQYVPADGTQDGFNNKFSYSKLNGGLDASYRLNNGYRLTGGYEYEEWDRSTVPLRTISWQPDTQENTFRIGLKGSITEQVIASVTLSHGKRTGDGYLVGPVDPPVIDPIHWGDRSRDKLGARINWMPTEQLDLQFQLNRSIDSYDGLPSGPVSGHSTDAMMDVGYHLNDEWQLTGWLSVNQKEFTQEAGASYSADLSQRGKAAGIGLSGLIRDHIKVGADLQYSFDNSEYDNSANVIPDVYYKQRSVNLFVDYSLEEDAGIRFDYVYKNIKTNDWTWDNFTYADGTTVIQDKDENGSFIGVSYYMKWR